MIEPAKENEVVKIGYKASVWLNVELPAKVYNARTQGKYTEQLIEDGEMGEEDIIKDIAHEFINRGGEVQMLAGDDESWSEFNFEVDEIEIEDGPEHVS
jgi:hypothetical protein